MLKVIGMAAAAALILAAVYALVQLVRVLWQKRQMPQISREWSVLEREAGHRTHREDAILAFHRRYKEVYAGMNVPSDALEVVVCSSVFSLEYLPVAHYLWEKKGKLHLFPVWESICSYLVDPTYLHVHHPREVENLYGITLPQTGVEFYRTGPDGKWLAMSFGSGAEGQRAKFLFLGKSEELLAVAFPQKEGEPMNRDKYLRSKQNVWDIKREMDALSKRFEEHRISREQYEAGKRELMRKL